MMRKALVVGINHYKCGQDLNGCISDSYNIKMLLERNSDGTKNFDVIHLESSSGLVKKMTLKDKIRELFCGDSEIALFYFSGHGSMEGQNGYIIPSDYSIKDGVDGISLKEIMDYVNTSTARNKIVILDSCHAGFAGESEQNNAFSVIAEGVTILTACTSGQYSIESDGVGLFTSLLVDALEGAAGNLVGEVSPGSVYAHIDQSLGPWEQRPIFRTNVKNFVSLRKVQAPISLSELQKIATLFPEIGHHFQLDPSFEPERSGHEPEGTPPPNPQNTDIFATLQRFRSVNLVVPIDEEHMWHAAMNSKACKLTVLGEHYHRLVKKERI